MLSIKNLQARIEDKQILNGINLEVKAGEVHAIMGPNGSGKSSLAYALMGHPQYKVVAGSVLLNGSDLLAMAVHERAKMGLFLSFQHPCEIPGVSVSSFLKNGSSFRMAFAFVTVAN